MAAVNTFKIKADAVFVRLLRSPKIICAVFLAVALPGVTYTMLSADLRHLEESAQQDANSIAQGVGERIGVVNTVLNSLVGLYEVANDLDNDKLLQFGDDILRDAAYIRHIGRYEKLDASDRDAFESRMSHNRYSDFSIAQIDKRGRLTSRSQSDTYYPITLAGPKKSTAAGLVGFDLAALPEFGAVISAQRGVDSTALFKLPYLWPLKGHVMLLRGMHNDHEHTSGNTQIEQTPSIGFWLALDMDQLFNDLSRTMNDFNVSVNLVDDQKQSNLFTLEAENVTSLLLTGLYNRKTILNSWSISPTTKLAISLNKPLGIRTSTVIICSLASLLITLASCLYTSYIINLKRSERERREGINTLSKEREKAATTLNSVQDAIITLDSDMQIAHINPAAQVQFNTRLSLVSGQSIESLVKFDRAESPRSPVVFTSELLALKHQTQKQLDVVPADQGDGDFVFRMYLSSSHDQIGNLTGYVVVLRDISHEQRLSKKLAYQANYDALTGCTNRHYFEKNLEKLINEMPTAGAVHTLCYLDLDQFKIINDTCGHRAGDQLLTEITKKIQLLIREQDILSRLGGDEFGLLLVELDKEEAIQVAQRVYDFFQDFVFSHQGNTFSITASIGVVHIDQIDATSKDVMASADIACFTAKDSGRNSMSVFSKSDENMAERSQELNWLPRLKTALNNNEFRLHVQAVASINNSTDEPAVNHFEFLLRLADENGNEVTPWQFIQAAERYDLMREIDRWVISHALEHIAQYDQGLVSSASFSINLSGQSAADPTLNVFIQEQIALHKVDASRIWFELTETAAISHFSVAVELMRSIRSTGAKIALDDFGSGLSSFGYLKNLPVDIIKIDGQFVKEIAKNPIDREMVRAIHRVGESMQIETVAEFVEDQDIVDALKEIGVDYAQGYHIGKPMPVHTAMELLENPKKAA